LDVFGGDWMEEGGYFDLHGISLGIIGEFMDQT